jgi:hypothetical protein
MSEFVVQTIYRLMTAICCLKMFHWDTTCYASHQSSGDLASELFEKMDKLVEQMLSCVEKDALSNVSFDVKVSVKNFNLALENLKIVLKSLDNSPFSDKTEILDTRDGIISKIRQFEYLKRFDC